LPLGLNENFPVNVHIVERFSTAILAKHLQEKLVRNLHEVNQGEFTFEEVANPTVPEGTIVFEFGLANEGSFNYLDDEELKTTVAFLNKNRSETLDFFCAIRYYKISGNKKTPLKFDYFLLRTVFGKELFEVQVYHERGPRYISPQDLVVFIVDNLNKAQSKKALRPLKD
jgi:hypothetical protein